MWEVLQAEVEIAWWGKMVAWAMAWAQKVYYRVRERGVRPEMVPYTELTCGRRDSARQACT